MNKLTMTILLVSYFFINQTLTLFGLMTLLLFKLLEGTHENIYITMNMIAYYFFGLFGIVFMNISSIFSMMTLYMYWNDVTIDTVIEKLKDLRVKADEYNKEKNNNEIIYKKTYIDDIDIYSIKNNIVKNIRSHILLNEINMSTIYNFSVALSCTYDTFVDKIIVLFKTIRTITDDVVVVSSMYVSIDNILYIGNTLASIKIMYNAITTLMPIVDVFNKLSPIMNNPLFSSMLNMNGNNQMSNSMPFMSQMSQMTASASALTSPMTPSSSKQKTTTQLSSTQNVNTTDIMKNMFGNNMFGNDMFGNDMFGMFSSNNMKNMKNMKNKKYK